MASFIASSTPISTQPNKIASTLGKQLQDGSDSRKVDTLSVDGVFPTSPKHSQLRVATAAASVTDLKTELEPLEKLKAGFLEFKQQRYNKEKEFFSKLAESQHPPFMIITCVDSRVDPARIFGLDIGDAFILRNVSNLVPPFSSSAGSSTGSAIEYGVLHLKVKHILVIGHSRCGGIQALLGIKEDGSNRFSDYIEDWVLFSKGASRKVKNLRPNDTFDEQCTLCAKESVNNSLWNVFSFPFVRDKVEKGELSLHGGYYDFVQGTFEKWTLGFSKEIEYEKYE